MIAVAGGCATRPAPPLANAAPPPPPLHLTPLADLVPAAGLLWIVDVRPRALFSDASLIPALAEALPEGELDAAARARGGLDLRAMDELVAAGYEETTLLLAHEVLDPAKIEAAFAGRVADVEGRAIDRGGDDPRGTLIRTWGSRGRSTEAVVVFGREAAGLALGKDTRLRAAELFAEEKLRKAQPAWRAAPLARMAELLGDAPVRAASPGPFEGAWSKGFGGLLAAATAAGVTARVENGAARVSVVLTGGWGARGPEAIDKVRSCYMTLADSGLGRLVGLDHPVSPPTFAATVDSVRVDVRLGIAPLLRGVADATTNQLPDVMRGPINPTP
jgi:hypothetical protein